MKRFVSVEMNVLDKWPSILPSRCIRKRVKVIYESQFSTFAFEDQVQI